MPKRGREISFGRCKFIEKENRQQGSINVQEYAPKNTFDRLTNRVPEFMEGLEKCMMWPFLCIKAMNRDFHGIGPF